MKDLREKKLSGKSAYKGHIINVRVDQIILSDGKEHFREVVEHLGGVVILPVTKNNEVVLIKQWRYPINQELIEFPAGKLEKGEDTLLAAKRELQEETDFVANCWQSLGFIYTAPGFCDEKLYFYKATDLTKKETNFDYGEIIEPYIIQLTEAIRLIKIGKINDSKTIVGINMINAFNH